MEPGKNSYPDPEKDGVEVEEQPIITDSESVNMTDQKKLDLLDPKDSPYYGAFIPTSKYYRPVSRRDGF
jgi:hypothetical protein